MPQLDENFVTVLSIVEFPEDIFDMFFVVDERNDYENDDGSSGDESPEDYSWFKWMWREWHQILLNNFKKLSDLKTPEYTLVVNVRMKCEDPEFTKTLQNKVSVCVTYGLYITNSRT